MNVSFERAAALKMLKHLKGGRDAGIGRKPVLRVVATGGRIYFEAGPIAAGIEALVLEPGAFQIQRQLLANLLSSFNDRKIILLEADANLLRVGNFTLGLQAFEPAPTPPDDADFLATGSLRISGGENA